MSEPEHFLKRWSRRKLDPGKPDEPAAAPPADRDRAKPAEPQAASDAATSPPKPAFDVSSLPPIESIDAAADVTAFLKPGVPAELTRAALRRAWSSDPAIRDFVGLAENTWDFKSGAVPGFGSVSVEDVARLMARLDEFTSPAADDSGAPAPRAAAADDAAAPPPVQVAAMTGKEPAADASRLAAPAPEQGVSSADAAAEEAAPETEPETSPPPRPRHGRALPK
jgi:hypothetical protein